MCAAWAGRRAAQLARTGSHGEKKAPDGHPGAVRSLWCSNCRDAELDFRAMRAALADGHHGWRRRAQIGHWKRVTGIRAPGGGFGRTFAGMPTWARGLCALRGLTGLAAGVDGLIQGTGSV